MKAVSREEVHQRQALIVHFMIARIVVLAIRVVVATLVRRIRRQRRYRVSTTKSGSSRLAFKQRNVCMYLCIGYSGQFRQLSAWHRHCPRHSPRCVYHCRRRGRAGEPVMRGDEIDARQGLRPRELNLSGEAHRRGAGFSRSLGRARSRARITKPIVPLDTGRKAPPDILLGHNHGSAISLTSARRVL